MWFVQQYWWLIILFGLGCLFAAISNQVDRMKKVVKSDADDPTEFLEGILPMMAMAICGIVSLIIGFIGLVVGLLK